MSEVLVEKLLQSFEELERCIEVTKEVLEQKDGVPEDVISRVGQYTEIVQKQRNMANSLRDSIARQDWEEVARSVKIINGLSSMIRDDAQAILSGSFGDVASIKQEHLLS